MKSRISTTVVLALAWLSSPMVALALQTERAFTPATRFNVAGQVTGTIAPDPDGNGPLRYLAVRNTYDAQGFLTRIERGELGSWLDESVAPRNWGNASTFAVRSTTEISYDSRGRKSMELVRGVDRSIESLVQYSYGADNRLECTAIRMNSAAFGSPPMSACDLGATGPYGPDRITRYVYDHLGQLAREDRAVGVEGLQQAYVTNTYVHRQLRAQTDANGNRTELRYDSYGRLWRRVYPHPTARGAVNESDYNEYTYAENGALRTERKRDGTVVTFDNDALNRPVSKSFSDPAMPAVYYQYDLRGIALYSRFGSDSGPGESNQYDGFGDLTSRTSNVSGTTRIIAYRYDANGNRTRVTHPDGYFFEYGFDGLNRVTGVSSSTTAAADSVTASLMTVLYANDGGRERLVRPGGSTTTYLRDNAGRLESFRQGFPSVPDSLENTFRYNPAGQIRELIQGNDQYNFREVANRTGAYVPNGLNQYTTIDGSAVAHDAKGNLTADSGATYRYDAENHLVETGGSRASSLSYDTLGRLAQFSVDGTTTQFLYDGDALIGEYVNGALTRRYVHGDRVDEPWVQYNVPGVAAADRRYLFADHQGSIIALANAAGVVLAKNSYDPYGTPAAANVDRFGFTGQTWLRELGLNYYKARVYSPKLGRFLQTDPVIYADDFNIYAYTRNDPLNGTDPSGRNTAAGAAVGCAVTGLGCPVGAVIGAAVGTVVMIATAAIAIEVFNEASESESDLPVSEGEATEGNSNDEASTDERKSPPNPNGSKGGEAHQGKIKERIQDLTGKGHTHVAGGDKPEETVKTPGGVKGSRRPDITTRDPDGNPHRENVGRQNQNGTPVSRERKAQEDIQNATGQCAFTPYNCK